MPLHTHFYVGPYILATRGTISKEVIDKQYCLKCNRYIDSPYCPNCGHAAEITYRKIKTTLPSDDNSLIEDTADELGLWYNTNVHNEIDIFAVDENIIGNEELKPLCYINVSPAEITPTIDAFATKYAPFIATLSKAYERVEVKFGAFVTVLW